MNNHNNINDDSDYKTSNDNNENKIQLAVSFFTLTMHLPARLANCIATLHIKNKCRKG